MAVFDVNSVRKVTDRQIARAGRGQAGGAETFGLREPTAEQVAE